MGRKRKKTYKVLYLIEKLIELLAVNKTNVAFAQQPPNLLPHVFLLDVQHDEDGREIMQQGAKKSVLVVLESPSLALAQTLVPASFHNSS
jgi:hypothetical protein